MRIPKSHKVSVVVPRTCWTFTRLPSESDDQVVNRFIYSILGREEGAKLFLQLFINECFIKEGTEEINAPWVESVAQLVSNETVERLLRKSS